MTMPTGEHRTTYRCQAKMKWHLKASPSTLRPSPLTLTRNPTPFTISPTPSLLSPKP